MKKESLNLIAASNRMSVITIQNMIIQMTIYAKSGIFAVLIMLVPLCADAQEVKVMQHEAEHGLSEEVPYIFADELKDVYISREHGDTLKSIVAFYELDSAPSVDHLKRLLGTPDSTERVDLGANHSLYTLNYPSATVEYETHRDGPHGIRSLEVRSLEWAVVIGQKRLYPGMEVSRLGTAIESTRQPVETQRFESEDIATFIPIVVAEEVGTSVEIPKMGRTQFVLFVNDRTQTIERIRFQRPAI